MFKIETKSHQTSLTAASRGILHFLKNSWSVLYPPSSYRYSRVQNVRNFMWRHCQTYLTSGRNIKHLLSCNLSIKCFIALLFLLFFSISLHHSSQLWHFHMTMEHHKLAFWSIFFNHVHWNFYFCPVHMWQQWLWKINFICILILIPLLIKLIIQIT